MQSKQPQRIPQRVETVRIVCFSERALLAVVCSLVGGSLRTLRRNTAFALSPPSGKLLSSKF